MIQDSLGLSCVGNTMQYGSVEKGLLVSISGGDDDNKPCTACFQAGQESDAQNAAHQAAETSSVF